MTALLCKVIYRKPTKTEMKTNAETKTKMEKVVKTVKFVV